MRGFIAAGAAVVQLAVTMPDGGAGVYFGGHAKTPAVAATPAPGSVLAPETGGKEPLSKSGARFVTDADCKTGVEAPPVACLFLDDVKAKKRDPFECHRPVPGVACIVVPTKKPVP